MYDADVAHAVRLSELETFVVCQNIQRYSQLMLQTIDTDKRSTLEKLLAEERAKLGLLRPSDRFSAAASGNAQRVRYR